MIIDACMKYGQMQGGQYCPIVYLDSIDSCPLLKEQAKDIPGLDIQKIANLFPEYEVFSLAIDPFQFEISIDEISRRLDITDCDPRRPVGSAGKLGWLAPVTGVVRSGCRFLDHGIGLACIILLCGQKGDDLLHGPALPFQQFDVFKPGKNILRKITDLLGPSNAGRGRPDNRLR
jgi:hypothetical protein